jgi:hypothetical protein
LLPAPVSDAVLDGLKVGPGLTLPGWGAFWAGLAS